MTLDPFDAPLKELTSKADEYEAMADGCLQHAIELRRYCEERQVAA